MGALLARNEAPVISTAEPASSSPRQFVGHAAQKQTKLLYFYQCLTRAIWKAKAFTSSWIPPLPQLSQVECVTQNRAKSWFSYNTLGQHNCAQTQRYWQGPGVFEETLPEGFMRSSWNQAEQSIACKLGKDGNAVEKRPVLALRKASFGSRNVPLLLRDHKATLASLVYDSSHGPGSTSHTQASVTVGLIFSAFPSCTVSKLFGALCGSECPRRKT